MPKLFQFPSKSSPGKVYVATLHDNGTATCDESADNFCKGFRYSKKVPRECRHTKEILKKESSGKPISKTLLNVNMCPVKPMLASPLPDDKSIEDYSHDDWILEEKYNGHRRIIDIGQMRAWSRVGNEVGLPPQIVDGLKSWRPCLIDSEIIVPGKTATDVKALEYADKLELYVFDILQAPDPSVDPAGTTDLTQMPLHARRTILQRFASASGHPFVHLAPQGSADDANLQEIWNRGGEGAILKRRNSLYTPMKRSKDWIKFKREIPHAMMVIGFIEGEYGPYSIIALEDSDGASTTVKSLNDEWRAAFAANPSKFIHQILMIEHRGRTEAGSFTSPMADHFVREDLIP